MADQKLDALTALPSAIETTDLLYVVRSATDYKATGSDLGLVANPVTAASVLADTALVVGAGGVRGTAASTLTADFVKSTSGVPAAVAIDGTSAEVVLGRSTASSGAPELLATTGTRGTAVVLATSPTLVTPILGTPQSGTLSTCTGLPAAGVTFTAPDKLFSKTAAGAGAGVEIDCTAAGRDLLDDANAAAQRVTLGVLGTGTPQPLGTAAAGNATDAAPFNHVHANPAIDTLAAATDITTLNASITAHGLLKKLSGQGQQYFGGDGDYHDLPFVNDFFLTVTASDIGGYKALTLTDPIGAKQTAAATITGTDIAIEEWAAAAGALANLSEQVLHIHVHAAKTTGAKDIRIRARLYHRTSGGTETLLGTSEESAILAAEADIDLSLSLATTTTFAATDRLVVKFTGTQSGTGSNPDAAIYYGETTASRIEASASGVPPTAHGASHATGASDPLPAKAIAVSMLADGTDGELITWDTSGVASTVAAGTTAHVLTAKGAGAKPVFEAIPAPAAGSITPAMQTTAGRTGAITFGKDGGAAAISTGKIQAFVRCPYAATIIGWSIGVDAGTATVKFWKIAAGTAAPTATDSINTSGVAISTGTFVRSTTVTDFTSTAITAGDILMCNIEAVATAKYITVQLEITKD